MTIYAHSCGQLVIARQKIQVDIHHAGTTVTIEDTDGTFRMTHAGRGLAEVTRTTTKPIARFSARKPQKPRRTSPIVDAGQERAKGVVQPGRGVDAQSRSCVAELS
ncbi:hypothetical protein amrb99_72470 [Actinomadura sp. RB99]|nr:hypothetical protein [Actinomadura sp. RB99]